MKKVADHTNNTNTNTEEYENTIAKLENNMRKLKATEKKLIEENKTLLNEKDQLKNTHKDNVVNVENKYKQDNTKLSSMNTKLKKDLQQVNNSLGEANVQMEVLKKKLLDAEEKSRKLESTSQATAKHVEKLKKDRDKAITQSQRHYENYEGLKEKHKITEEEIALLKKEKIQARMIINPSSTKKAVGEAVAKPKVDRGNKPTAKRSDDNSSNVNAQEQPKVNRANKPSGSNNDNNNKKIDNSKLTEQLDSLSAEWEQQQKKVKSQSNVSKVKNKFEKQIEKQAENEEVAVDDILFARDSVFWAIL